MKRLHLILLSALALCALLLPPGAVGNEDDLPHVRSDGRRLMFGWHGGAPHRVDVSNLVRAVTLEKVRVLAAQRDGDFEYFIVSVSGPSQAGEPGTSNPSGTESNLLWLKLKSWKVVDSQATIYQSFLDSLVPIGDYRLKGGILTIRFTNKRESTDYVLRYDESRPDGKITLVRAGDIE
jgi:hypothetical protein